MPKAEESISIDKKAAIRWLLILVIAAIVGGGWLWWNKVYTSSDNVFWGMMSDNLSTESITRHINQTAAGQTTDQYIQVQLGSVTAARNIVTISQNSGSNKAVVKSETIGTPTNDYSRYVSIKTDQKNAQGKPLNTAQIIGLWGKTPDAKNGQRPSVQYLQQSLLGLVPFANLASGPRTSLIRLIRDSNVYTIDSTPAKSAKQAKRPVFIYSVSINPKAYISMLQQFVKDIGLGDIGLDPSQYNGSQPLKAEFTVDKVSRQLVKVAYPGSGESQTYSAQGLEQPITVPTQTIPISELQTKVQNIR
jgi:hypothetical protein